MVNCAHRQGFLQLFLSLSVINAVPSQGLKIHYWFSAVSLVHVDAFWSSESFDGIMYFTLDGIIFKVFTIFLWSANALKLLQNFYYFSFLLLRDSAFLRCSFYAPVPTLINNQMAYCQQLACFCNVLLRIAYRAQSHTVVAHVWVLFCNLLYQSL